jgi:hypothetical protein
VPVAVTSVVRLDNGTVQAAVRGQVSSFPELLAAMVNSSDLVAALDDAQRAKLTVSSAPACLDGAAAAAGGAGVPLHVGLLNTVPLLSTGCECPLQLISLLRMRGSYMALAVVLRLCCPPGSHTRALVSHRPSRHPLKLCSSLPPPCRPPT